MRNRPGGNMLDIAIDVGSGVTKARSSDVRTHLPSLSGMPDARGFDLEELPGATVDVGGETYVVGDRAKSLVHPDNLANTRDDRWFESDAYLALLYAAMARVLPPDYSGKVALCTGLPQALYNDQRPSIVKRLARKHRFTVDGVKFSVHLRADDIQVMPQVMGLFLSRLALDKSLQVQKVGLIDVGTYTSDWTIVEDCRTIQWAAGGTAVGIARVISAVSDYLRHDLRIQCTDATINDAIHHRKIIAGDHPIELGDQIDQTVLDCAGDMIHGLFEQWRGAKDAKIVVGGGGGQLFAPAIRIRFPHARVIEDEEPIYSIVDGYYTYIEQRRRQRAA